MPIISCPECRARVSDRAAACPGCGYPIAEHLETRARAKPLGPMKYLYGAALALGLLTAGYIYLVRFDDLSETTLVQLTPVWMFLLVLGYYGWVAERMAVRQEKSGFETVADVLFGLIKTAAPGPVGKGFAVVVHLPFLIVKSRSSLRTAAAGAAIWAITLWIFFAAIFPQL